MSSNSPPPQQVITAAEQKSSTSPHQISYVFVVVVGRDLTTSYRHAKLVSIVSILNRNEIYALS